MEQITKPIMLDETGQEIVEKLQDIADALGQGGGVAQLSTSVLYSGLVQMRNAGTLVPGMWYRITDYVCYTSQAQTDFYGHQFDVIVRAIDNTRLDENACAAHHEGDTYFQYCKLEAWELKYCLDNDTDRFAWADGTNGKGVIYYMKDERDNIAPYDFKNIMFKGKIGPDETTVNDFTFSCVIGQEGGFRRRKDYSLTPHCYGNKIGDHIINGKRYIPRNVFRLNEQQSGTTMANNTLGDNCYDNMFFANCNGNTLGHGCYTNTFGNNCDGNTLGAGCHANHFTKNCNGNTFGVECEDNTLGGDTHGLRLGGNCNGNTFGEHCQRITSGNNCGSNTFGNYCKDITLGSSCQENDFGNFCRRITVFEEVSFCSVTGGDSGSHPVINAQILNGTHGDSNAKLTIGFAENEGYMQAAGLNSDGQLKIWVPADLVQ